MAYHRRAVLAQTTLPDRIALLRIALVPVVMVLVLVEDYVAGFVVFTVAALTDFVDGYLARRWDQTSVFGAFLDSIADKLLILGTLFALVEMGRAWAWAGFVIVGREVVVTGLRGVAGLSGTPVPPSIWGKIKAWAQFIAVGLAIVRFSDELGPLFLDEWLMLAAIAVTIVSAIEYFARFSRVLRPVA